MSIIFDSGIGRELAILSATLLPGYFVATAVYQRFFSPLSSIPGPWYAAVSDLWLLSHVVRLRQCMAIHDLFEEYGPIVRTATNKVAFRDINAAKAVYTKYKFDKSDFYKNLQTNNNDHAMTTLPHLEHAVRKKGYAPHYTPSHINLYQPEMQEGALELAEILEDVGGKTPMECLSLFRHMMMDIIAITAYGTRVEALKNYSLGIQHPLTTAVEDFPVRGIIRGAVPKWAWEYICRIPNARWRQICDSDRIMAEAVGIKVNELKQLADQGKLPQTERSTLLHRLVEYGMDEKDIISEGEGHTVAGVDTSSTTLSYLFWEMSRRPDIAAKLQAELDEAMPDSHSVPDVSVLQKLPYLTGFVKEGFRIYAAGPTPLERVVPATITENDVVSQGYNLMGFQLPPGTVVATQSWSLHREESVFPSANTFLPERWIETADNKEDIALMNQYLNPFGLGARLCGGMNLAQSMIRIVVALVARNFDIIAPPETNARSMEITEAFVIAPVSKECKLKFIPRNKH